MTMDVTLPKFITSSEEFLALNDEQQASFGQKIRLIKGLLENMRDWVDGKAHDSNDAWSFFDNLELDSWSIISMGTMEQREISAWLIHSSWTFESNSGDGIREISKTARQALDSPQPKIDSPINEVSKWVTTVTKGLSDQITVLENSTSLNQGIASLVIIDTLICYIHAIATKMRLNPNLIRP